MNIQVNRRERERENLHLPYEQQVPWNCPTKIEKCREKQEEIKQDALLHAATGSRITVSFGVGLIWPGPNQIASVKFAGGQIAKHFRPVSNGAGQSFDGFGNAFRIVFDRHLQKNWKI